ncbi:MAG: hypothetical protein HN712_02260 [Gemmatimonadetes bacterium]|jgi:hypothetical protein|nr:hypothetical protein [Gemmatimonadota bacterium]MBT6143836.1 hypothetical protein [Gemmatimonadota bacterium]MBT7859099.1 hypothetical protein [Gemmatimonadota bacterium]
MSVQASPIRAPRWSRPTFLLPEDQLSICVEGKPDHVSLQCEDGPVIHLATHTAASDTSAAADTTLLHLVAPVPAQIQAGLYDLVMSMGGVTHRQPRAVRIDTSPPAVVRIAYTSDWHLLQVSSDGSERDQTPRLEALVDELNRLGLDAIVHLGDLITRYQLPSKAPQPVAVIESQMKRAHDLLGRLTAPLFLLPGNHDVAFDRCRASWAAHVGHAPGPTDDSAVTLGPVQLVQLDGFVHYDEISYEMGPERLTNEQLDFVNGVAATRPARWRLVGCHYDYSRQILPHFDRLGVDAFFYGHSKQLEVEPFEAAGCADGHLAGSTAYRLALATEDMLDVAAPVSYQGLP